jgi:hypothetical protein
MLNQIRQGDVFLLRVKSLPIGAGKESPNGIHIILAHGEVTGHAHRIQAAHAHTYKWHTERYLEVNQPTKLVHEEHSAIDLSPGTYKIVIQREYAPNAISQILD